MTETRTHDLNRDLWVWSRDGKPFFVTCLDPHGPFGAYLHLLLCVARRQQDGYYTMFRESYEGHDLCLPS